VQATIATLAALLVSVPVANALVPAAVIGTSLVRDARTVVAKLAGLAVVDGSPVETAIAPLGTLLETVAVADALVVDIAVVGTSLVRNARSVAAKLAGLAVIDGSPVETAIAPLGTLLETVAVADALVVDIAVISTSLVRDARTVVAGFV
jgi:hypothetical protein